MHSFTLPLTDPVIIFMVVLLLVLLIPIVPRKTKTPSIIGLIVAGIILGPYALDIIANNDTIELFSNVGLYILCSWQGLRSNSASFARTVSGVFSLV
ncbi:MAG TPA: hypothetical protein ENH59_04630 [Bacteroidetes bacterium]|nr:hypothetical protein [Bacteroidota bacterium]